MALDKKKQELYWAAVASELNVFLQQSFSTVYPNKEYLDNWHIQAIVYCLKKCIEGEYPRLNINMPPRHLKSFVVSVVFPAFVLAHDPTAKIICISYSEELAKTLARDFRRIVQSEWYIRLFPKVDPIKSTENEFVTSAGGSRFSTSVGGTLTGRGGDFIIVDDPIKPEDTNSDTVRNTVNEWYKSTLLSRLDDKKRSVLILVMQRLHVNDLTGFVEASGGFYKLALAAIARTDELIPTGENKSHVRKAGSALHEAREDLETLQNIKNQIGPTIFSAQYQQSPETPEGSFFKSKWINKIKTLPDFNTGGRLVISFDTALSTAETADYTAVSVIYSSIEGHFVLSAERGRWDYEMLLSKALSFAKKYKDFYFTFIIESAGTGISLLYSLRKSNFNCKSASTRKDKLTRAAYVLPIIEQNRLFILDIQGKNEWVAPYINEIVTFPNGRYDDQVDSLVHALYWAEPIVNPKGNIYLY